MVISTDIVRAINQNEIEKATKLITECKDVLGLNEPDPETKLTPLACAAQASKANLVRLLIERGATIALKGEEKPIIFYALESKAEEKEIVATLKALPRGEHYLAKKKIRNADGHEEEATPLMETVRRGHVHVAHLLLESGVNIQEKVSRIPPLVTAVERGDYLMAATLFAKMPEQKELFQTKNFFNKLVSAAVLTGQVAMVKLVCNFIGKLSESPFFDVVEAKWENITPEKQGALRLAMASVLLKKVRSDVKDENEFTELLDRPSQNSLLLNDTAKKAGIKPYHATPLMLAIEKKDIPLIKFFLYAKANLCVLDVNGRTILTNVVMKSSLEILNLILKIRAPDLTEHGDILGVAVERGLADRVQVLMLAGADPNFVDRKKNFLPKKTALVEAILLDTDNLEVVKELLKPLPGQTKTAIKKEYLEEALKLERQNRKRDDFINVIDTALNNLAKIKSHPHVKSPVKSKQETKSSTALLTIDQLKQKSIVLNKKFKQMKIDEMEDEKEKKMDEESKASNQEKRRKEREKNPIADSSVTDAAFFQRVLNANRSDKTVLNEMLELNCSCDEISPFLEMAPFSLLYDDNGSQRKIKAKDIVKIFIDGYSGQATFLDYLWSIEQTLNKYDKSEHAIWAVEILQFVYNKKIEKALTAMESAIRALADNKLESNSTIILCWFLGHDTYKKGDKPPQMNARFLRKHVEALAGQVEKYSAFIEALSWAPKKPVASDAKVEVKSEVKAELKAGSAADFKQEVTGKLETKVEAKKPQDVSETDRNELSLGGKLILAAKSKGDEKQKSIEQLHDLLAEMQKRSNKEMVIEDTIEASDEQGRTALMWAAISGFDEAVKILLAAGALPWIRARGWMDAAMFSAVNGQASTLKLLLETGNVDVYAKNQWGKDLRGLAQSGREKSEKAEAKNEKTNEEKNTDEKLKEERRLATVKVLDDFLFKKENKLPTNDSSAQAYIPEEDAAEAPVLSGQGTAEVQQMQLPESVTAAPASQELAAGNQPEQQSGSVLLGSGLTLTGYIPPQARARADAYVASVAGASGAGNSPSPAVAVDGGAASDIDPWAVWGGVIFKS